MIRLNTLHQTIGDALCYNMTSANLTLPLCNYSFQNYLCIHRYVRHSGNDNTPTELFTKERPNLRGLRTCRCRVYIHPPCCRQHCIDRHANKSIYFWIHQY